MWEAIVAAGISAYSSSRSAEKQNDKSNENQLALLNRAYELDKLKKEDQRKYMKDSYAAYAPYGAGGAQDPFAQYRPAEGQPATTGGLMGQAALAPQSFYNSTRRY